MPGYNQTLITAQSAGAALTASIAATSILPAAARLAIPPNYFSIGKILRIEAAGQMSTVTTPGTLTFTLNLGPSGTIIVFAPAALSLNATATTNQQWEMMLKLTCRAIGNGTNANLFGRGRFMSRSTIGAPAVATESGVGVTLMPDTAPVVGSGFDSTVTNYLDLIATWGTNNANSIQLFDYEVTDLNFTP